MYEFLYWTLKVLYKVFAHVREIQVYLTKPLSVESVGNNSMVRSTTLLTHMKKLKIEEAGGAVEQGVCHPCHGT